jgi:Mn2+/Fe2+ NRAMP family transporter
MSAIQEMCARIALQTGTGLGAGLRRKFPAWLVGMCILALGIANTINLGADLGAVAAGGELLTRGGIKSYWLVVPAALLILAFQIFSTYQLLFTIFKWLTLALFAYVIDVFLSHPDAVRVVQATFIPHVEVSREFITALVAVLGTTISPYLFFWQASSEVDEMKAAGLTSEKERRQWHWFAKLRHLRARRLDILIGMGFSQLVMYAIILTSAAVLHAHGKTDIQTAQDAATALEPLAGPFAFILFSLGIIGTGLLAIPILSGSATYAVKEFMGLRGSLAVKARYRPTFYAILVLATLGGVAMNFLQVDPIRALFVTAVINGLLAPPVLILIVLLGSDRRIMRARVSGALSKSLTWAATAAMTLAAFALVWTSVVHRG